MALVDPFIQPIPEKWRNDPELRAYIEYLHRFLHDLWQRTGGANDTIESSELDLTDLRTDVDDNTADIATNAAAIIANSSSISANSALIATNIASITTNTANIATNTANIAINAADIASNAADILVNSNRITSNDNDISSLETDVATNAAAILANSSSISANSALIATNIADITTNSANITTNASNIAINAADIAALEGLQYSFYSISTNRTTAGYEIIEATAALTVTLNATPSTLETVSVKRNGAGVVTISGTIDGASSFDLLYDLESVDLVYNGAQWMVV